MTDEGVRGGGMLPAPTPTRVGPQACKARRDSFLTVRGHGGQPFSPGHCPWYRGNMWRLSRWARPPGTVAGLVHVCMHAVRVEAVCATLTPCGL